MKIRVRVKPNSKREGIEQLEEGLYQVRVHTPPVDGKANKRVIELLSKYFKVAKSGIELVSGPKSKYKTFLLNKKFQ